MAVRRSGPVLYRSFEAVAVACGYGGHRLAPRASAPWQAMDVVGTPAAFPSHGAAPVRLRQHVRSVIERVRTALRRTAMATLGPSSLGRRRSYEAHMDDNRRS